jgi:NADPH:quinone reductase
MTMAISARITQTGGPEAIQWVETDLPPPGPGEVRMRNSAVGLNYIDVYHRSGVYPIPLPSGLGMEAAGVIEAVGEGVSGLAVGDRVCTFGPAMGAYCDVRNMPAAQLFKTPDGVSDEIAAAALLKACTVEALVERCAKVEAGWPVLVHAAAGGVGLIMVQWLKAIGATVIGTVSSNAKAELAKQAGADHVILTNGPDIAAEVRALTGGAGVKVVFDGVGAESWEASLKSTAQRGLIVTLPTLFHYYADPAERAAGAARVFAMLGGGTLSVSIGQRYALPDAAQAHIDLEARNTVGSTVLLP